MPAGDRRHRPRRGAGRDGRRPAGLRRLTADDLQRAAQDGHPTAILHARTTVPAVQNFVITVPIERRPGAFRYRVALEIPPIAAGRGSLTHLDVDIGRRYRFRGIRRSYISARCRHNVLSTYGRFTFAEGAFLAGSVEKACTPR